MPAQSKKQQRYFGMVKAGKIPKPEGMTDAEVEKYASTKRKGLPDKVNESSRLKSLVEGMTFTGFLIAEAQPEADTNTVRGYIRSLPHYQELISDQGNKSKALQLAKQLVDELGDGPLSPQEEDYILDQFDELSSQTYRGANLGDWRGEDAYKQRRAKEKEIERQSANWAREMGTDAETGEPIKKERMRRGATHQQGKFDKARAEMQAFRDAPPEEQGDRLAQAKGQVAGATGRPKGEKMQAARAIFDENFGERRASEIIRMMMDEIGISKPHATTYYYNLKKKRAQQQ